jgi:hypothetical protein
MTNNAPMTAAQIKKALEAGIISKGQADSMLAGHASPHQASKANIDLAQIGDEENLRFLRSFSDVFIAIGLVILGFGAAGLVSLLGGGVMNGLAAIACFALAFYFGKKKRAHLPCLVLALAFLIFTQAFASTLFAGSGTIAALITLCAMSLFYYFIRLPFCIALIALASLYLVFALIRIVAPTALPVHTGVILMVSGLIIFALALIYDTKDVQRKTRFSDNAFWLHFLAAPMIIHGFAIGAIRNKVDLAFGFVPTFNIDRSDAMVVLILVGIITFVGLAINRRGLIVSSLGYAGISLIYLVGGTGLGFSAVLVATLLLLGATIVLLGAVWHGLRNIIIKFLPKWKIFPPAYED